MNRKEYLRRVASASPRGRRRSVVEATSAELDELEREAREEGLSPPDAARRAIEVHREGAGTAWSPWSVSAAASAPFRAATWRSMVYLALLFPLGLVAGLWAGGGLVLVVGLSLVGVGLLLVVPFLLALRPIAQSLGFAATWATGQPMPLLHTVPRGEGALPARIGARLKDPETVAAWVMCLVSFVLGQVAVAWFAGFGSAVVYLLGSLIVPGVPLMPGGGAVYPDWLTTSAVAKLLLGILCLWVWAWGTQALAWIFARITRGVLTRT